MNVDKKNYSSIWEEDGVIKIIDQTKLPFRFEVIELKSLKDFLDAIKKMKVRGAPLIGVTAAYALAVITNKNSSIKYLREVYDALYKTRPTAVNLKWALNFCYRKIKEGKQFERRKIALSLARTIRNNDIISSKKIAFNGYKIIEEIYKKKNKKINILTHCNAGWLATVDWGTALAPIFLANRNKIPIHIWVDETRPRNQGALLTAWELKNENVPYTVITDNAGGYLMSKGEVDLCIVGSDRITRDGDVCNKIGTYLKALAAKAHNIPFYVAAPTSTIDLSINKGEKVPIEVRNGAELSRIKIKKNGSILEGDAYFPKAKTFNPAFDITPSSLVSKIITEYGVMNCNRKEIDNLMKK